MHRLRHAGGVDRVHQQRLRHLLRRASELREHEDARIRRIEFFELPKTNSGKIRRVELRERENEAAAAGVRPEREWRDDQFPDLRTSGAGA